MSAPLVAKNLRKFRLAANLHQADVARPLQVTAQLVSLWEHGYEIRRVAHLVGLAEVFGVTQEHILGRRKFAR